MRDKDKAESQLVDDLSKMRALKEQTEKELSAVRKELEIQTWGLKKTNEAIKLLYKDLEEKNARLKELDRMKSDFISTVSHELRTPLSISREGISIILDEVSGAINGKQRHILATARDNIDRLARIIDNLLDISKIESGKVELKKEEVDITALIKEVVSSFESKTKEKGLELKAVFSADKIKTYSDADRITQVFTNLIGNAVKFTERGHIEVSAQEKKDKIECYVADTGAGIVEKDLPRVFGKFEQFGRTAGPGEKGTGLGLSITKAIVEMHGGRIRVESKFGKGTKFIFSLPKHTAKSQQGE